MHYYVRVSFSDYRDLKIKLDTKGDWKGVATMCNNLGLLYAQSGCYDLSLKEHKEELKLSKQHGDRIGVATSHRRIGEVLSEMGDHEESLHHLQL